MEANDKDYRKNFSFEEKKCVRPKLLEGSRVDCRHTPAQLQEDTLSEQIKCGCISGYPHHIFFLFFTFCFDMGYTALTCYDRIMSRR